jgi:hypothetical protein
MLELVSHLGEPYKQGNKYYFQTISSNTLDTSSLPFVSWAYSK